MRRVIRPWTFLRETLESVSSRTRFSCILKISNFGFNRSSSKLVGMFFGIVTMFVLKDFVQYCFADLRQNVRARRNSRISATKQS